MCAVSDTESAVSLTGSVPNSLTVLSAGGGPPSFGRQDWGGIAFLESWYSYCPDGYVPVDVTSSTWFCGSNGSLVRNAPTLYSVCQVLSCPSSVLLEDDLVEGLGCYSLTLGEAWVVSCADGYTAAGDTET